MQSGDGSKEDMWKEFTYRPNLCDEPGRAAVSRTRIYEHRRGNTRRSVTDVIGSHSIHFLNLFAEGHGLVDDELEELVRGGLAGKQLELLMNGTSPRYYDKESNLETAQSDVGWDSRKGSVRSWHREDQGL